MASYYCPNIQIAEAIKKASGKNGNNFNIIISSKEGDGKLPKMNPISLKDEIKEKVTNMDKIKDLKRTNSGKLIISTEDVKCAMEIIGLKKIQNCEIKANPIWENITSRVLIHQVDTDVELEKVYEELIMSNPELEIKDLRRFIKPGSQKSHSPVLITLLGTVVPDRIKIWLTSIKTSLFVDRPKNCSKCQKFDHSARFCKETVTKCGKCGETHTEKCTSKQIKCANCAGNHYANSEACEYYQQEKKILEYKSMNRLTITEARRTMAVKTTDFNKVVQKMNPMSQIQEKNIIDAVGEMIKKNNEMMMKQFECILGRLMGLQQRPTSLTTLTKKNEASAIKASSLPQSKKLRTNDSVKQLDFVSPGETAMEGISEEDKT